MVTEYGLKSKCASAEDIGGKMEAVLIETRLGPRKRAKGRHRGSIRSAGDPPPPPGRTVHLRKAVTLRFLNVCNYNAKERDSK